MRKNHRGMVLLVSLVLLLMLTVIAITAASQSNLQLRIASNSEQQNAAFQASESGLQQWTNAYFKTTSSFTFPENWSNTAVGEGNSRNSVSAVTIGPCSNFGLGRISMNCFDIQSVGEHCADGVCTSRATHRQGGQRREINQ